MPRDKIHRFQLKKARSVVKYAVNNSPFFKDYYKDYDLQDVWNLPTVNKKIMMDNFSTYNTLGFDKNDLLRFSLEVEKSRDFTRRYKGVNIGMSSGTSGNKGLELTTPHEEKYLKAMFFARFIFPKKEKLNLAFILRVSTPAFNLDILGHRMTYISQLDNIENITSQLETLQPNIISAPPSMHEILAREFKAGRLRIRPKRLVCYAEVLSPDSRLFLQNTFDCEIHEIYKCTEGAIAMSCKEGSLHINEDLIAVQLFDKNGKPTVAGKPSYKMIITDLHKHSQPIIRYELNDIITISPTPCKCGSHFRVIQQIQGRRDDIFWGKLINSKDLQFIFPDYIRRAIISCSDNIIEYQAIQKTTTKVFVRIVADSKIAKDNLVKKITSAIEQVFFSYDCKRPTIEVVFDKPIVNPNSQKMIRIQRMFAVE